MGLTLVLGGTRSGKSARGERLAGAPVRYVATADGSDPAMAVRIAAHVARRPASWATVEADDRLAPALGADDGATVLVDGLGPWIATALHRGGAFTDPAAVGPVRTRVLADVAAVAAAARDGRRIVVVAEEAGHGLLPADAGSRAWLDLLGEAVQHLAGAADHAELVVAGRPLALGGAAGAPAADPALVALRRHGDTDVRPGDADHAVNVLAGGPPPWLRDVLASALDGALHAYPDERDAVAAIAALHGRPPEEVVVTNGAAEALWLLPAALRPALAAVVHPGFTEGEAALRAHGVAVTRVLRDAARDFALDPSAVPDAADLVLIGNPASPSGTLDPAAALLALVRPGRTVVVDEAFMDLVPGQPEALADTAAAGLVVVRSLTKSLGVPGLRAGYALAPAALAARLRAVRPPWSVNALALAALAAAARRPEALAAAARRADAERSDLAARLAAIPGLRTWPARVNFCLVEVPDGPAVTARLRDARIAVRPAASFPGLGPHHLRLTARGPEANARLARALEEAVAACG